MEGLSEQLEPVKRKRVNGATSVSQCRAPACQPSWSGPGSTSQNLVMFLPI